MQGPRILFISRAFPPVVGGIEKQNAEIYKHLCEKTYVALIANRHGKRFLPLFLPYAVFYVFFHARRYDVILLGDGVLAITAWFLRLLQRRPPVFCILHGLDLTFPNLLYQRFWMPLFLPKVDMFIPVSRETAKEAVNRGIAPDRCRVIPNGVDPDEFAAEYNFYKLRGLLRSEVSGKRILLTVGRLVERKGVHWFVENVIPKLDNDIVYVIAGNGPMRKAIEKAISENGLDSRVLLLGKISDADLKTLYAGADVYVQPNIQVKNDIEGFGLVVLEAGAAGLPVIASRLEGLAEAISDGENGQLITPGCVEEYVTHINALIHSEGAIQIKGQKARNYVRRHYQWTEIADRYTYQFQEHAMNVDNQYISKNKSQEI